MNLIDTIHQIREPLHVLKNTQTHELHFVMGSQYHPTEYSQCGHLAILPPIHPEWLGSADFLNIHQVRFPYIVGEMANGIATARMVIAAVQSGMLGFFGAAGLLPEEIEKNLYAISRELPGKNSSWGSNLIHSPHEPHLEEAAVDLYLRHNVQRVSASAYLALNPAIVRYACTGLRTDSSGNISRKNRIFAKISRPEVAKQFMQPAPSQILEQLVQSGKLTQEEAALARYVPIADDITVEADSGGHTDNRPLSALFPTILALANQMSQQYQYKTPIRIGAAGGLGTPSSLAAAFTLGAAYVLTGSVNQSAVESGLSTEGKMMLADAGIADVMMAPAADMFELGVKLQVLKRGSLFGSRAAKLYEIYTQYEGLENIPDHEKLKLEKQIFGSNLEQIWQNTQRFFEERDPNQLIRASQSSKHKMALVFRWYLGLSSHWAIRGETSRKMDFQIWCGPAMGAFNAWAANSFLENISERTVAQIGRNLLEGAAIILRAQQLRTLGIQIPNSAFEYKPKKIE